MTASLDHTVVHASDKRASAEFLAGILGLAVGAPFGPFIPVDTGNGVTLDFYEDPDGAAVAPQHYAFLVPDEEFDTMIDRLKAAGVTYYADPHHTEPNQVNRLFGAGARTLDDLDGHNMEIMTRPYARPA